MTDKHQNQENRLGHDPLEWLEHSLQDESEEEQEHTPEETDTPSASADQETPAASQSVEIENFTLDGDVGHLILPERLLVQMAESFCADLREIVKISELNCLILDASNVESVDTTGVQLLFALVKHLNEKDKKVEISQPSDVLISVLQTAGLSAFFETFIDAK